MKPRQILFPLISTLVGIILVAALLELVLRLVAEEIKETTDWKTFFNELPERPYNSTSHVSTIPGIYRSDCLSENICN